VLVKHDEHVFATIRLQDAGDKLAVDLAEDPRRRYGGNGEGDVRGRDGKLGSELSGELGDVCLPESKGIADRKDTVVDVLLSAPLKHI
jgi:hypothetical protein